MKQCVHLVKPLEKAPLWVAIAQPTALYHSLLKAYCRITLHVFHTVQHIGRHKIPNIPIMLSVGAQGWGLSLPEMERTKPPGSNVTPLGSISHCPLYAPSTPRQRTAGSHASSTRNALRSESNSSNPPRFRAFRRGGIHLLWHTSGLKNSAAKWEGHLKCSALRLWSVVRETAQRANICNFGIYL